MKEYISSLEGGLNVNVSLNVNVTQGETTNNPLYFMEVWSYQHNNIYLS